MNDPFGKKKKEEEKKKDGKTKGDKKENPVNKQKDEYKKPAPMFSYEGMAKATGMDTSKFKKRHPDGKPKKKVEGDDIDKAAFGSLEGATRTGVNTGKAF